MQFYIFIGIRERNIYLQNNKFFALNILYIFYTYLLYIFYAYQ